MKRMTSKSRLGLQQKLLTKLSPQQIQLMKLLQLPVSALEERIQAELEAEVRPQSKTELAPELEPESKPRLEPELEPKSMPEA